MKFSNAIQNNAVQYGFTENGAITLQSSTDPVLDMFFLFGASRGKNITPVFEAAYENDAILATKVALWGRDCRGGAGERQLFRDYLHFLAKKDSPELLQIINGGFVQNLGRWDDLLELIYTPYQEMAIKQIANGLSDPHTVGLVAKWMPRQGNIANTLAAWFRLSPRNWRKLLVRSTNVVEQKMCAKEWDSINFEHVPSVAASRYQKAFTKHAPEQYAAYKNAVVKGEAKVNASTLYPYDVLKSERYGDVTISQAQWDALPNYLGENGGILPIVDVSGSMGKIVPGTSVTMMDVAISLGLYIADKQQGDFHNVVMNFSSESEILTLTAKSLRDKFRQIQGLNWGMSTDLNAAFENLLEFGNRNHVENENMPKTILIMSDMEFNMCGQMTNLEAIERKYARMGYDLPQIVFWNLNGRQGNSPARANHKNVALISGFSPSIVRSVLSGKSMTPRDIMLETLNSDRYNFQAQ